VTPLKGGEPWQTRTISNLRVVSRLTSIPKNSNHNHN
jgi:hypothetical protein